MGTRRGGTRAVNVARTTSDALSDRFGTSFSHRGDIVSWIDGPNIREVSEAMVPLNIEEPLVLRRGFSRRVFQNAVDEWASSEGANPIKLTGDTYFSPFDEKTVRTEADVAILEAAWDKLIDESMKKKRGMGIVATSIMNRLCDIYAEQPDIFIDENRKFMNVKYPKNANVEPERVQAELRKFQITEYPDGEPEIRLNGKFVGMPPPLYVETAKAAKMLKADLANRFPGTKFSVRSRKYAGGSSIDVNWVDGPTEQEVERLTWKYHGADFDGMTDSKSYHVSTIKNPDGSITMAQMESDFVFTRRKYSKKVFRNAVKQVCEDRGFKMPRIRESQEIGSSVDPRDDDEVGPGLRLSYIVSQRLKEMSF